MTDIINEISFYHTYDSEGRNQVWEWCIRLTADSEPFPANGAVSEVSEYSGVNGSCYHAAAIVPISVPLFYNGRGAGGRHTTWQGQLLTDPVQDRRMDG